MITPSQVRVVILAGGFGTRVSHLLPGIPKPMAPVAGRPFVEWVVRFFLRHGFSDFVISTGHLSEVIERHFAASPIEGTRVRCCQETTPLGTAGGFLNCVDQADRPQAWLVTNGDSLVVADPDPLLAAFRVNDVEASVLGLRLPDAARFGTLDIDSKNRLRAFREKQPGPGLISGGVYAFLDTCLDGWPEKRPLSFEYDIFPGLAVRGKIAVHAVDAPFIDIGTPATLADAEDFIVRNKPAFTRLSL